MFKSEGFYMEKNVYDYYKSLNYKMVIIQDEEGLYTAYYPDLPGCITCGSSPEEVFANAKDAKMCWLKAAIEDGISIPEPSEAKYNNEI